MQLLKISSRFINPHNITEIHDLGDVVQVYFAVATGMGITLDHAEFTGQEAIALRQWLERNSTDVLAAMQQPAEQRQTPQ